MRTVFGSWFVERKLLHHPVEGDREMFDVGQVIGSGPDARYHTSSEIGFSNFEEAKAWVLQQPGALPEKKQ